MHKKSWRNIGKDMESHKKHTEMRGENCKEQDSIWTFIRKSWTSHKKHIEGHKKHVEMHWKNIAKSKATYGHA